MRNKEDFDFDNIAELINGCAERDLIITAISHYKAEKCYYAREHNFARCAEMKEMIEALDKMELRLRALRCYEEEKPNIRFQCTECSLRCYLWSIDKKED